MISLTELAKQKLTEIIESEGIDEPFLRLKIVGGGCAGFSYDMCFVPLSDKKDGDEVIDVDGSTIKLLIDPISHQYLEDCTVDYQDSLIAAGFKFLNPKATGSCGCGNSVSF